MEFYEEVNIEFKPGRTVNKKNKMVDQIPKISVIMVNYGKYTS